MTDYYIVLVLIISWFFLLLIVKTILRELQTHNFVKSFTIYHGILKYYMDKAFDLIYKDRILVYSLEGTKLSEEELNKLISNSAKVIAEAGHEIVIIPDRGIPLEFAKLYKRFGGRIVYGLIPAEDKKYGIRHIEKNLNVIDKQLKEKSWYDVDGEIASKGELCIIFGMSPGIVREFSVLKYHYRYLNCKTKVLWFENTISRKLPDEIMEEFRDRVIYIKSATDLKKFI